MRNWHLITLVTLGWIASAMAQEATFSGPAEDVIRPFGGGGARSRPGASIPVVPVAAAALPADAQALVKVFDKDAAAIREKAEQEIHAKRQTLVQALQALQDAYTRDAKLDEAVAIRDAIRQLKSAHLKPLPNPGNLSEYVHCIGQTFYFDVVGQSGSTIWGTEVYTYDSDLATAAVHAGVLKVGERGIVKVTIYKSPAQHRGSTQNGVTSHDWGSYSASYTVERPF